MMIRAPELGNVWELRKGDKALVSFSYYGKYCTIVLSMFLMMSLPKTHREYCHGHVVVFATTTASLFMPHTSWLSCHITGTVKDRLQMSMGFL